MGKLKDFVQGEFNSTLDKVGLLDEEIKRQAEERQEICSVCKFLDKKESRCGVCKCSFPSLTLAPGKACPRGYWKEMII